ncbi:MAG TPA: fumarylacetoacetate hydrolase family protein [Afifellaceae bacterium]|nr:fumarylacetoacetate hydrolase family protein [Afifellaceae bacterium]
MKLVSYQVGNTARTGIVRNGTVYELRELLPDAPATMRDVIEAGSPLLERLSKALDGSDAAGVPLDSVKLLMPLEDPGKVICLGLNYADHAKEGGHDVPEYPSLFLRVRTSLIAHDEPIVRPRCSERLDYEAELMVIVGKKCRHLDESNALDPIFGYSVFNDGSIRDYQRKTAQWTAGKNFDATGPVGPWIVTADELPPGATGLRIRSMLGDRTLQDSNTSNMIFSVQRTMILLTEIMTLEPGDMIAMGTPEGVGHPRNPPLWLKPGDRISIDIEHIGTLSNPVVDETAG